MKHFMTICSFTGGCH